MIVSEKGGGDFPQIEPGAHAFYCYGIVDIGTQSSQFGDKRQLVLLFESAEEDTPEGEPYELIKFYGATLHPNATLRKHLESWRNQKFSEEELRGFDMSRILGKACTGMVINKMTQDGKSRSAIDTIGPPPRRQLRKMSHEPINFSLDPTEFDAAEFAKLNDYLRGRVEASPEYKAIKAGGGGVVDLSGFGAGPGIDDLPF